MNILHPEAQATKPLRVKLASTECEFRVKGRPRVPAVQWSSGFYDVDCNRQPTFTARRWSAGVGAERAPPASSLPQPSLSKGGGAIRDIGEKFGVSPATGTG